MPYCTSTQVQTECKLATAFSDGPAPAATNPNATKVGEIIAETDASIDSVLRPKYTLPVTDTDDLLVLRRISLALCAERVREIMGVVSQAQTTDQKFTSTTADKARSDLKAIQRGDIQLNTTPATSRDGSRSYASENGIEPVFKRGEVQW